MKTSKTDKSQGWKSILKIFFPYLIVVGIFQVVGMLLAGVDFKNFTQLNQSPAQFFCHLLHVYDWYGWNSLVVQNPGG